MTSSDAQLLSRIEAFDIDGGSAALSFAARLARENGWSRAHADRVVIEYKRFVFLALTAGESVCPSEAVDTAWHLHLTFTKSYWKRFCGEVLGRPLHHEPTRGGPAEAEKHWRMYEATRSAFRRVFGAEPPADIWPPASDRFGDDLRHRVVNTARNWVIPKRPVIRFAQLTALFATMAVVVPGCEGGPNPFDLEGAMFLAFLIPAMLAAVCLGRLIRSIKRDPMPAEESDPGELSWQQLAYLSGGAARLTTAAITRLVSTGAVEVEGDKLVRGPGDPPAEISEVDSVILNSLPCSNTPASVKALVKLVEAVFADEAEELEENGYLLSTSERAKVRFYAAVPFLIVLLGFGLPRLAMGVVHNKPFGDLLVTMAIGGLIGLLITSAGRLRITRRGDAVIKDLQKRHQSLVVESLWSGTDDAALAVALFGIVMLSGPMISVLETWMPRKASAGWSGGCGTSGCGTGSGCGGGDGGGGDGGGGDGGGGGGCGGCGGGGGCGGCGGGGGD